MLRPIGAEVARRIVRNKIESARAVREAGKRGRFVILKDGPMAGENSYATIIGVGKSEAEAWKAAAKAIKAGSEPTR